MEVNGYRERRGWKEDIDRREEGYGSMYVNGKKKGRRGGRCWVIRRKEMKERRDGKEKERREERIVINCK